MATALYQLCREKIFFFKRGLYERTGDITLDEHLVKNVMQSAKETGTSLEKNKAG